MVLISRRKLCTKTANGKYRHVFYERILAGNEFPPLNQHSHRINVIS